MPRELYSTSHRTWMGMDEQVIPPSSEGVVATASTETEFVSVSLVPDICDLGTIVIIRAGRAGDASMDASVVAFNGRMDELLKRVKEANASQTVERNDTLFCPMMSGDGE